MLPICRFSAHGYTEVCRARVALEERFPKAACPACFRLSGDDFREATALNQPESKHDIGNTIPTSKFYDHSPGRDVDAVEAWRVIFWGGEEENALEAEEIETLMNE